MDRAKEERIQGMVSDILDVLSYEELEEELKKIGHYHCVNFKSLQE